MASPLRTPPSGRRLLNQWNVRARPEGICSTPHFGLFHGQGRH